MRKTSMDVAELATLVLNSKSFSDVLRKLSRKPTGGNFSTLRKLLQRKNISTKHFEPPWKSISTDRRGKPKELPYDALFVAQSQTDRGSVKRRLIRDSLIPYVCQLCGQPPEWNNRPLTLVLDHINGVNNDHRLENLRFLCPNCNAQTDTFSRGATRIRKH